MSGRLGRLARDPAARTGAFAAAPGLWLALAWVDPRPGVAALALGVAAGCVHRAVASRRRERDGELIL